METVTTETTIVEEGQGGTETEQGTTIPELEVGPQDPIEEVDSSLPSDQVDFTMPDKFEGKSAEEIAKAYVELEKFKAAKGEAPEVEAPTKEPTLEPENGVKGNKYYDEYQSTGGLSDESYAELEAQGINKADANDRLEFEAYKAKKQVDELVTDIGGIEEFTAMDEWAKTNMDPTEVAQIAEEMQKASTFGKKAIIKEVYSRYKATLGGGEPQGDVVHTNEAQTTVSKGYADELEFQTDLQDPRYGNDRLYTQAVEKKIARTKVTW